MDCVCLQKHRNREHKDWDVTLSARAGPGQESRWEDHFYWNLGTQWSHILGRVGCIPPRRHSISFHDCNVSGPFPFQGRSTSYPDLNKHKSCRDYCSSFQDPYFLGLGITSSWWTQLIFRVSVLLTIASSVPRVVTGTQ